jgi:16S rRNA (guanine527-N7)-methyltransferase
VNQAELAAELGPLGLDVTDAQYAALEAYVALLARWGATHNLTAVHKGPSVWTVHVLDCMAALSGVSQYAQRQGWGVAQVLDVGSGAGLPGILWALWQTNWRITCVDAVAKKVAFIQQAAVAMRRHEPNLQLVAHHGRVERLAQATHQLVVARAFASLADLVRLTRGALAPDGVWVALKGEEPHKEMAALPSDVHVFHVEPLPSPRWDASRCLVWMKPA